jgi:hypothetical protein
VVTTTAPPTTRQAPRTSWGLAAVIGTVAVFAAVVAWSVQSGAIRFAYSDDWGYLRIAERFVHDGHLEGVGWNDTALMGQVLASKVISPITGGTVAGLRVLTILCAAGSLVLVGVLARRTRGSSWWPVVPLSLVVMVGFGSTIATYMTEQAALVAQLGSLVLGLVAWTRWTRSGRFPVALVLAVGLVGAWGGCIRQAAVAAPLAVMAALLTHPRARAAERRVLVIVALAILAAVLLLMVFTPLDGPTMAIVRGSFTGQVARLYQAVATLALFLVPVGILTGWFGRTIRTVTRWAGSGRGRAGLAVIALVVILGGVLLDRRDGSLLVGNSLQEAGGYQGTDVTFPRLFNHAGWGLVLVLAAAALFLFTVFAVDRVRAAWTVVQAGRDSVTDCLAGTTAVTRVVAIWTVLGTLGVVAVNLAYRAIYDRYLIPIVIGFAILALDNRVATDGNRRRLAWTAAAFVPVLCLGMISAVDSQDLLALRWAGADRLVELGYAPTTVDAGFDWVGYHYGGVARPDRLVPNLPDYPPATYDTYFPDFVRCAIVSGDSHAPPGYVLLDRVEHHRLFGLRTTTAYLYGNAGSPSCPPITGR